jgi:trigger factor
MDMLVPEVYQEALDEHSITPVANPSVELVSHEPLVFTATVPLEPVIDLGDYQSKLRLEREAPTVTDDEVEEQLKELRRRYGTIEPVDRPAQKGDIIRGNVKATMGTTNLINQDEIEFRLTDETLASLPGLADLMAGMKKGDTLETSTKAPEDFPEQAIAGNQVDYNVTVHEVKEEKLADADDAFAKEVGEGFDSLKALRDRIREDLDKAANEQADREYETKVLDALVEQAKLEFPSVLIERQIDSILEGQASLNPSDPHAQELYLERLGKSEEEVRESVRLEAEERLRRSLVLSQFAEAENIDVEDSEVEQELDTMAAGAGEQSEMLRAIFANDQYRDTIRRSILTRKTFDRLREIASADGGPKRATKAAAKKEEAPKAAPKSRRSGPRQAD